MTLFRFAAPMGRQREFVRFCIEHPLSAAFTGVVLWVVFGVMLYRYANDWTYAQSFYYTVQSGLSIGFGLLEEKNDLSKVSGCLILLERGSCRVVGLSGGAPLYPQSLARTSTTSHPARHLNWHTH